MDHGGIARILLRRRSDLEKNAFLGRVARGAGNFAMRAAENAPGTTLLTVGGGVALGPSLLQDAMKKDPVSQQRAAERRHLAQQMRTNPMKVKIGSVISRDDVQRGLAIRQALEKRAAKKDIAEELTDALFQKFRKVRRGAGKPLPEASAAPGDSALYQKRQVRRDLRRQLEQQAEEHRKELEAIKAKQREPKPTKLDHMMNTPMKMFLGGMALSAGAMATGGAGMGMAHLLGKGTEFAHGARQKKHYGNMLKADPTLKREPKARAFFNVLHKASPFIATEPHVAAATVRSMLDSPEGYALHPKFMKEVLDIEEKRQKTRYPAMRVPTFKGDLPDLD